METLQAHTPPEMADDDDLASPERSKTRRITGAAEDNHVSLCCVPPCLPAPGKSRARAPVARPAPSVPAPSPCPCRVPGAPGRGGRVGMGRVASHGEDALRHRRPAREPPAVGRLRARPRQMPAAATPVAHPGRPCLHAHALRLLGRVTHMAMRRLALTNRARWLARRSYLHKRTPVRDCHQSAITVHCAG